VVPEDDLQAAVVKALRFLVLPPAVWFAMPVGHVQLSAAQAARMARIGTKKGLCDIFLIYQGRVLGIELKSAVGSVSPAQREVFPLLEAAGVRIEICRSIDDVVDALAAFGCPLRGHS
jgi:hypothetical protein